jgi:hypothetical protein
MKLPKQPAKSRVAYLSRETMKWLKIWLECMISSEWTHLISSEWDHPNIRELPLLEAVMSRAASKLSIGTVKNGGVNTPESSAATEI